MRKRALLSVVGLVLALPGPGLQAHPIDAIAVGEHVGPIRLNESRLPRLKEWFGEPTSRKIIEIGCVRAVKMRWGVRLVAIAPRYRGRTQRIAQVLVLRRTIHSSAHGDLTIHTGKGLRIGDSEDRLQELYPNVDGETHRGHTHYVLRANSLDGRLLARVERGIVVNFLVTPYEFC
jgi:hypothetical protein